MKITLGYFISGKAYCPLPASGARAGEMTCGATALISLLETMYGLPVIETPQLVRVAQYERALATADNGNRFYSKSFAVDSLGAAFYLLAKRDELLMASGTDFHIAGLKDATGMLADMAEVEKNASLLAPGIPDRLRVVVAEIKKGLIPCNIEKILLIEPETWWELLWQELFRTIKKAGSVIEQTKIKLPESTGDLAIAKSFLGKSLSSEKKKAQGDGSCLLIEAVNISEAADAAVVCIRNMLDKGKRVVVVSEGPTEELHFAMRRFDLPSSGCTIDSWGQDALQILPLFLQLLYAPCDPWKMQQFLSLSISPLPRKLRVALSDIIADTGGTGGKKWKTVIEEYLKSFSGKERADKEKLTEIWLRPGIVPSKNSLKSKDLTQICSDFRAWALKRRHADENNDSSFAFAAMQAETLSIIVDARNQPEWTSAELVRVLSDIAESFPSVQAYKREKGGTEGVFSPGAILAPTDAIVWWNATESSVPSLPHPFWSGKNLTQLKENGVCLQRASEVLDRQRSAWFKAAGFAKERLLLFFARLSGDTRERDEVHPIWHELIAPFTPESAANCIIHARDVLNSQTGDQLFTNSSRKYSVARLPAFREVWNIPPKKLVSREYESPSSLEMLIGCPLQYVLNYNADIRPTSLLGLPEDAQLYGKVAHEVLERYLTSCKKWPDPSEAGKEAGILFDKYIQEEASILLLPGCDAERARLKAAVMASARVLADILKNGGYEVEGVETEIKKDTGAGPVRGFCDLILRKIDGSGILDLKWSGGTYRRKLLEKGRATQLAAYSRMSEKYPPTGFFIIKNATLLTIHPEAFPGSMAIKGPREKDVWKTVEDAVAGVRKELASGKVQVGIPEEESGTWLSMLPANCTYCGYGLFCGVKEKNPL